MVRLAEALKGIEIHGKSTEDITEDTPASRTDTPIMQSPPPPPSPKRIYKALIDYMDEVGRCVADGDPFDIAKGEKFINALINIPQDHLHDLHQLALMSSGRAEHSFAVHASNIAINSIILGYGLEYTTRELQRLGLAALFHELGMYLLPDYITEKQGKLNPNDWEILKKHCKFGSDTIRDYGEKYNDIAEVISQEHERKNGSGYPKGLSEEDIHPHAYIIGLLDIFEAMIQKRAYRTEMSPAEAMREIIGRSKGLFPNLIIKKLLMIWSFYPVKTYVRLNNKAIGMVVDTNPLWPLKPSVKILIDANKKKPMEDEILDLSQKPLIHIKETLSAADVSSMV